MAVTVNPKRVQLLPMYRQVDVRAIGTIIGLDGDGGTEVLVQFPHHRDYYKCGKRCEFDLVVSKTNEEPNSALPVGS
jgi:hypothetical protein